MRTESGHYVSFAYDNRTAPKQTTCIIKDDAKQVVVSSSVTKHHKDVCSKDKARRFALTKALREANFSKQQRQQFWVTYLQNVKS